MLQYWLARILRLLPKEAGRSLKGWVAALRSSIEVYIKNKDTKSCNNSGARQSSNRSKKSADLIMRIYEGVKVMYDNSLG